MNNNPDWTAIYELLFSKGIDDLVCRQIANILHPRVSLAMVEDLKKTQDLLDSCSEWAEQRQEAMLYRFMRESVMNGKDEGYALTWCDGNLYHPVDDPDSHIKANIDKECNLREKDE